MPLQGLAAVARNAGWSLAVELSRLPLQAAYFLLVARSLGADGFGIFAGVAAVAAALGPFANLGGGMILLRDASREPGRLRECFGRTLRTLAWSGSALAVIAAGAAALLMPRASFGLGLLVGLADLLFLPALGAASYTFVATDDLRRAGRMQLELSVLKLAAAGLLAWAGSAASLPFWALLYCAATAAAAALALRAAFKSFGRPQLSRGLGPEALKDGLPFSLAASARNINNDIDKAFMARWAPLDESGAYAAAYRILTISLLPVKAVMAAAQSGFFRHGAGGLESGSRFVLGLMPVPTAYAAATSAALWLAAPLAPLLLGPAYAEAAAALRWLSPLPLIRTLQEFPSNALTGSDHNRWRAWVHWGAAGLNLLLCLALIPRYSWRGAAWASLASDGAQLVAFWAVFQVLRRAR